MPADDYLIGDFDDAGHLWIATLGTTPSYYEIDFAPDSSTFNQVLEDGTLTNPAGLVGGEDWTFIRGAFYRVMTDATNAAFLVKFDSGSGAQTVVGALGFSKTGAGNAGGFGATYTDAAGHLYASDNLGGAIYRIEVTEPDIPWIVINSDGPPSRSEDGARCALAPIPTITVKKSVAGRVQPDDQFTVGLRTDAGEVLTSATTSRSQTSVSTPDWPVTQGAKYTITDAMAHGSPDALAAYTTEISCIDSRTGKPATVDGTGPTWTLTVTDPAAYTCTVTNTPIPRSYRVTKQTDVSGPLHPGETVTYRVQVRNTGHVPYPAAAPAAFTDDLSGVLDDATYNGDATGGVTVTGNSLTWSGPLAVGESVTVTYSVTVNNPDTGDMVLTNTANPTAYGGRCADGSAGPCPPVVTKVASYHVTKTVAASTVAPGDTVTYTITVSNTGQADYTDTDPASFVDDLSGVLDDAQYNGDADHGATYAQPELSWSGALPVGKQVTITYSVTVDDPASGDGKLHNLVVTPSDPGAAGAANCPSGSTDSDCWADASVRAAAPPTPDGGNHSSSLPSTGTDARSPLVLAGLLLAAGSLVTLAGIRRRRKAGGQ